MDELGLNKLFAGILVAGLMLMAGIKLADVLVPHSELTQNAYVIEVPEGGTAVAEAPKAAGPEPIFALLASADAIAGEKLAKKCTACHVFDQGGANKVGPALWNIVNADKGAVDGFSYSGALGRFWRPVGLCGAQCVPVQAQGLHLGNEDELCRPEKAV
ncbi:MAG: hypothetical protein CM15mP60_3280 [Alphaproteobacteria bacterium]|nr:MAG: hypothetical protein CM15mP60_3280 [Alphaproteobacteria bacterium]